MTALEQIGADPEALREAHPLVHHIGQRAFAHYGTARWRCRRIVGMSLVWLCYHGVLQAFLSSLSQVEPQHILPLCPISETVSGLFISAVQLSSWFGHGLTIQFRYDVLKSLAFCDALPGAGTENPVTAGCSWRTSSRFQQARRAQTASGHHHHEATSF